LRGGEKNEHQIQTGNKSEALQLTSTLSAELLHGKEMGR
jgi:hypothetical protein